MSVIEISVYEVRGKDTKTSDKPKIHIDFWDYKPKIHIDFWDNLTHHTQKHRKAALKMKAAFIGCYNMCGYFVDFCKVNTTWVTSMLMSGSF